MHGYQYSYHIPHEHQCLPCLKICMLCWPLCSEAAPEVLLLAAGLTPQVSTTLNSLRLSSRLKTSIEAASSYDLLRTCATRCTTSFPSRCLCFWRRCEMFVDMTLRIFSTASSHPSSHASAKMELTDSLEFNVCILCLGGSGSWLSSIHDVSWHIPLFIPNTYIAAAGLIRRIFPSNSASRSVENVLASGNTNRAHCCTNTCCATLASMCFAQAISTLSGRIDCIARFKPLSLSEMNANLRSRTMPSP